MAYDEKGRLILSHDESTATIKENIANCLGDFRVSTLGRDLGILCTSPKVNNKSLMKPYRCSKIAASLEDRRQAKYGWSTHNKSTSETMSSFLDRLKANGVDKDYWSYLAPRGGNNNEPFRAWDFDGYDHYAKAYGEKALFKRYGFYPMSIKGYSQEIVLKKNSNTIGTYGSPLINMYSSVVIQVAIEKLEPMGAVSSYNWDVEGTFTISIVSDSGSVLASETFDVYSDGNNVPDRLLTFRHDITTGSNYKVIYTWNIDNRSYFWNGNSDEYFDIKLKFTNQDAYTLAYLPQTGRAGVAYVEDSSWNYDEKNTMFGDYGLLLVVELTNGTSTERKMGIGKNVFLFEKAGFSQSMIDSFTKAYIYVLRADVNRIFNVNSADLDYYGDISLANYYEVIPYHVPFKDVVKESIPVVEMEFYPDDFQYMDYTYSDNSTERVSSLTANGANCGTNKDIETFTFVQNIYFENVTDAVSAKMFVRVYSNNGIFEGETNQLLNITHDGSYIFVVDCVGYANKPADIGIVVGLEINRVTYYLDIYNQVIVENRPEPYPLGI